MGLTERHLFENEDVPENYEWDLEDAVYNSLANKKPDDSAELKYPCEPYRTYGCGLDFNHPKYKENCYFYGETKDMGATIRYCTLSEIKWGYCPCEKCDEYNTIRKEWCYVTQAERIYGAHQCFLQTGATGTN